PRPRSRNSPASCRRYWRASAPCTEPRAAARRVNGSAGRGKAACYSPAMSNAVARRPRNAPFPRMGRLSWLMELYGENHCRLARMFDPESLAICAWVSSVGDGMDLHLDVLERHAYTVDLRLTYGITDPATGVRDPSAFVRVYRDDRQAEATHCYVGQRWQDVLGLRPDPKVLVGHRLRM